MTDYSVWTDEQVNEAIAEAKGRTHPADFIDYTHDWRLCGELLEEMPGACLARNGVGKWYCNFNNEDYIDVVFSRNNGDFDSESPTPQRAICEAWLAWKEQG